MPAENYANDFTTTVAGAGTGTGTGSKQVASTTGLDSTSQYRLRLESEYVVGLVVDGTHINFLERAAEGGGAAVDHAIGVTVEQVLTKESLLRARALVNDFVAVDDFVSGTMSTGAVGVLGWQIGAGTYTSISAPGGHPGVIHLDTGATGSTVSYLRSRNDSNVFLATDLFDITWIVRPVQADGSCILRIGCMSGTSNADADGAYFAKAAADTTWQMVSYRNGVGTLRTAYTGTTTAITANNWYRLRVRRIDATNLGFTVNDDVEVVWNPGTNLTPNIGNAPFVQIVNSTATSEQLDVDYCSLRINGLTR